MTCRRLPFIIKRGFAQHHHHGVTEPAVLLRKNLGTRQLILNRPRKLNAIDDDMVDIIHPNLRAWEESSQAKIVFLKGVGRAFCAGGDVKDVVNRMKDPKLQAGLDNQIDTEYELLHYMGTMKTPYIAVMDGITMGGGAGFCAFAPFRIATENTQFAMPETSIGLFCDVGASFFLSRFDGHLGAYMGATSRVAKGEDALFSGFATHFVHSSRIEALEARLAEIENPTHDIVHNTIEEFAVDKDHTPETYTLHGEDRIIIDKCFKHETVEEVVAALKEDGSKFAKDTLDTMMKRSPTSLKITHEHLRKGINMSLMECLRMEQRLWQTVPHGHDFIEGVQSHVIKKQQPKWKPSRLEDLDLHEDILVKYFHARVKRRLHFSNNIDYHIHPYLRYALPTESEILDVKKSRSNLTTSDIVEYFDKNRNGKFGVRQKVEDVLYRNSVI